MRTLGARDMIRDRKESLFPLEYPKLVPCSACMESLRSTGSARIAAHIGIDPGTKRNRNGNVVLA
jgi:hypothetical protein